MMSTSLKDELKPCPFCGCTRIKVTQRDGVPLVTCCECWGENWTSEAWNRREESIELKDEVSRLKEVIKTAQADGANALVASFENVDPRARICELEAEVARLKEAVKRLPELTWKTERYREVCDVLKRPQGMVESIKKEWIGLKAEKAPETCVPPKIEGHSYPQKVYKPEFDKLCARVEALEQKAFTTAGEERRRIVSYIRNIGGDYHTTVSTKTLAEEIENGNHWK